jgi:hypothetical protein
MRQGKRGRDMRLLLIALLAALIAGCSPGKWPEQLLKEDERAFIQAAVDDVAREDAVALSAKVPPELRPAIQANLPAMRRALPAPPHKLTAVYTNVDLIGDGRTAEALYQIEGSDGWATLDVTVRTSGGAKQLAGLYLEPMKGEPKRLHPFRLADGGAAGLAMVAAMVAAVAVTIAALVRIWRSGLFRRRWLWTIGALCGLTVLKLNWSTGELSFQPLAFQIFSASAVKSPIFAPWVLGVSVPVVALIALFKRTPKEKDASAEA